MSSRDHLRRRGKALSNIGMILGLVLAGHGQWWGLALVVLSAVFRPLTGRVAGLLRRRPLSASLGLLPDADLDLFDALAYYGEDLTLTSGTLAAEAQSRDDGRVPADPEPALLALHEAGLVEMLVDIVDGREENRRFLVAAEAVAQVAAERERRLRVAPLKRRSRLSPLAKRASRRALA